MTFDVVHDEKGRADDIGIFAEKVRPRHRYARSVQRAHHLIFTFDGVRRRQQMARGFSPQHEPSRRCLDVVGRIRLSTTELAHEKRWMHTGDPRTQVALEDAHIELMRVKNIDRLAREHWEIYNRDSGLVASDPG